MKRSRTDLEKLFGPYTHMLPEEVQIWERWLAGEGAAYAPYNYDVKVGKGLTEEFEPGSMQHKIAMALTRKRIDAVAKTDGQVWLFEVKPRAGTLALGELQVYEVLYRQDTGATGRIRKVIITDRLQPDMQDALRHAGIEWREV